MIVVKLLIKNIKHNRNNKKYLSPFLKNMIITNMLNRYEESKENLETSPTQIEANIR